MKTHDLKKLANLTIQKGTINKNIAKFVLKKMDKYDLKKYLFFLKSEIHKNNLFIKSADGISTKFKTQLLKSFQVENINTQQDLSLGAGLVIKHNDIIIDLTLKNMIENTVEKLKEEL